MSVNPCLWFGPKEEYERLQGRLYMLLSEAILKATESAYQPPSIHLIPNKELEEEYMEECRRSAKRVEECATEIYKLLTGRSVKEVYGKHME